MSQDNLIGFECMDCRHVNYYSKKNKKKLKARLEMNKLCTTCGHHTKHKETKI
ncbi:50S ribosomal protein L33 [Candidatus Uhrbacteria bacterium]|nr:50S ribosomal protein L33 [Candidatus Uhrbacteria bacterium]